MKLRITEAVLAEAYRAKVLQGIGFRNIRKECTVERFKPYVEKASTARRVSVDFNAEYQAIYTKRLHFLCSLLKV